MSNINYKDRLELASHFVDGAWLSFNLPPADLKNLPADILAFKKYVDKAREMSYEILGNLESDMEQEYFKLRVVD